MLIAVTKQYDNNPKAYCIPYIRLAIPYSNSASTSFYRSRSRRRRSQRHLTARLPPGGQFGLDTHGHFCLMGSSSHWAWMPWCWRWSDQTTPRATNADRMPIPKQRAPSISPQKKKKKKKKKESSIHFFKRSAELQCRLASELRAVNTESRFSQRAEQKEEWLAGNPMSLQLAISVRSKAAKFDKSSDNIK